LRLIFQSLGRISCPQKRFSPRHLVQGYIDRG
jgi:hypothetical protein